MNRAHCLKTPGPERRWSQAAAVALTAAVLLAVLLTLAGCSGEEPPKKHPRLILFGIDAANWNVLTPMIQAGELPAMTALVNRGSFGVLKSGVPIQSPQMWTSIATGVVPEKHGITRFTAEIPGTDREVPVTSNMRKVKAFWNILSEADVTVGIVGWWPSWPAEEVNGFMIAQRAWPVNWSRHGIPFGAARDASGRLIVEEFPGRTYPDELYKDFEPFIVTEEDVTRDQLSLLFQDARVHGPGQAVPRAVGLREGQDVRGRRAGDAQALRARRVRGLPAGHRCRVALLLGRPERRGLRRLSRGRAAVRAASSGTTTASWTT